MSSFKSFKWSCLSFPVSSFIFKRFDIIKSSICWKAPVFPEPLSDFSISLVPKVVPLSKNSFLITSALPIAIGDIKDCCPCPSLTSGAPIDSVTSLRSIGIILKLFPDLTLAYKALLFIFPTFSSTWIASILKFVFAKAFLIASNLPLAFPFKALASSLVNEESKEL